MKKRLLTTTAVLVFATTTMLAGPASADTVEGVDEIVLATMIDGVMTPLSDEILDAALLDLDTPPPADPNTVTPYLIGFNVWVDCYIDNQEEKAFALYTRWWNGVGKDVRLKCGNQYWGYKHIQNGHQQDWQNKLDAARNAGWNQGTIATGGSWDDLMSAATSSVILYPDHWTSRPVNDTTCVFATLSLVNVQTQQVVYEFNVRANYANNSDRLITSFPTKGTKCPG